MIILLGLVLLVALGVFLIATSHDSIGREGAGVLLTAVAAMCLLIAFVSIPVNRMKATSMILEIAAVQKTIEASRAAGNTLEGAAFQMKIAEANAWIASAQYYNATAFDIWIPDEVDAIEPIK